MACLRYSPRVVAPHLGPPHARGRCEHAERAGARVGGWAGVLGKQQTGRKFAGGALEELELALAVAERVAKAREEQLPVLAEECRSCPSRRPPWKQAQGSRVRVLSLQEVGLGQASQKAAQQAAESANMCEWKKEGI